MVVTIAGLRAKRYLAAIFFLLNYGYSFYKGWSPGFQSFDKRGGDELP
jgi:hypothetical protein